MRTTLEKSDFVISPKWRFLNSSSNIISGRGHGMHRSYWELVQMKIFLKFLTHPCGLHSLLFLEGDNLDEGRRRRRRFGSQTESIARSDRILRIREKSRERRGTVTKVRGGYMHDGSIFQESREREILKFQQVLG